MELPHLKTGGQMIKTGFLPLVALLFLLASCGGTAGEASNGEGRSWEEIAAAAEGTTVNFFMFGGAEDTNAYVDEWVAPRLREEHGIELVRTPVSDTSDAVNKLLNEKQAGREEGTIDLLWLNGENFYTGSQADLWWGPWAEGLPNARYIDWEDPQINLDFGYPVDGYEAPWSQAQFVMIYDSERVEDPPESPDELLEWARQNPGRFTYPAPPDFFGNAFILQLFYQVTEQVEPYQGEFDREVFEEEAPELYEFLNELEPHLWRGGETYPASGVALDELYQNGEVDFTVSYNPYFAQRQVERGIFPETTRTYLFQGGTLSNTSYVAIPFNAPNKEGAQVVANFLQSPEAQAELQRRNVVGGLTTLDVERLPEELREEFEIKPGPAALSLEELQANRLPEARTEWQLALQDGWASEVQRK
jgi:putative spermidine/putrescine transport system substrate-binding protein